MAKKLTRPDLGLKEKGYAYKKALGAYKREFGRKAASIMLIKEKPKPTQSDHEKIKLQSRAHKTIDEVIGNNEAKLRKLNKASVKSQLKDKKKKGVVTSTKEKMKKHTDEVNAERKKMQKALKGGK